MLRRRMPLKLKLLLFVMLLGCLLIIHETQIIYTRSSVTLAAGNQTSDENRGSVWYQNTNLSGYEVRKAHLQFLPEFKSPCWLEPYTDQNVYSNNLFIKKESYPKKIYQLKTYALLHQSGVQFEDNILCDTGQCRVRCLPYFMLLGVHKSGTTDICNRLNMHPQVFSAVRKEVYWWSQLRFADVLGASLGDYADLFDKSVMEMIKYKSKSQPEGDAYWPAILGEFTAMSYFDMSHWRADPENAGQPEPVKTTPYDVYRVNPGIRLLVSLRNPTSRLYSHYNLFHRSASPEDFHRRVEGSIWWWETCIKTRPLRNCAYGSPPHMPPVYNRVGNPNMWWNLACNYSGEIRTGIYVIHAREWLKVFPRDSLLFIKMEEYSADIPEAFNQHIFPFLGLHRLSQQNIKTISEKKPFFQRKYNPMLDKTKVLLDQFYKPFNEELADLLGDGKWLWDDT